jgi:hypothetical protein
MSARMRAMTHTLWWGVLALGFLLHLSVASQAQAQVSFAPAVNFATRDIPLAVAIGNLDGDGDLDLAVPNAGDDNVSILLNSGTASFVLGSLPPTGLTPIAIAIGDLDGDGDLDLAVTNETADTVSILLNNGAASFAPAPGLPPATGDIPNAIAIGDLDGDGDLDLAVTNEADDTVSILLNNGAASFVLGSLPGTGFSPSSIAIGDLDRDGDLDLAVTNALVGTGGTVSILLNNGAASFAPAPGLPPATGFTPSSIAIGDLDRDGDLDLAVTNEDDDNVSILLNNGAASFAPAPGLPPATGFTPVSIALGDLDRDGDLDLVVANNLSAPPTVSVLLNTGSGSFGTQTTFGVGFNPTDVAIGDLDGDGDLDLAVTNAADDTVSVLLNTTPPPAPPGGGGGGGGGGGCFIATAAFGSPMAPQVQLLREFRDRYLLTNAPGRLFVAAYYRVSPPLAKRVGESEILRAITRTGLLPVLAWVKLVLWSPGLGLAMTLVCPALGSWLILKVIRRREERT